MRTCENGQEGGPDLSAGDFADELPPKLHKLSVLYEFKGDSMLRAKNTLAHCAAPTLHNARDQGACELRRA